jgi:hypothetical protein
MTISYMPLHLLQPIPAGSTALESPPTNWVVRSDATMDGCAWGNARLKFDFVAIVTMCESLRGELLFNECILHFQGPAASRVVVAG